MFKQRVFKGAQSLFIFMALLLLSAPMSAQVNNCCSVDRQCTTDSEWISGYYAFRNSQCGANSQQQAHQARSDQTGTQSNNCCFSGWQCSTNAEWISGYWAFRNDQCSAQAQGHHHTHPRGHHPGQPQPQDDDQRQQLGSTQGTDETDYEYESSRQCTTLDDGTLVCVITLTSWEAYWRAVCRTYPQEIWDLPECR
ncbi:MAG: hypothetical protein OXG53_16325 [Chloroflexi bacterium]|nr:hypothetical protein [Chloroflexota bacterium]